MKTSLATKLFFFSAIFSLVYSVLTKFWMNNKDILRQKGADIQITPSILYISIAVLLLFMALIYYLFDKSTKFHIKSKYQLIQYFLFIPLVLILFITNFLETFFPGASSSDMASWIFVILSSIATIAFIPGVIMFFVNIIIGLSSKR